MQKSLTQMRNDGFPFSSCGEEQAIKHSIESCPKTNLDMVLNTAWNQ